MIGVVGGFREDAISFLDALPTIDKAQATRIISGAETFIKNKAREGVVDGLKDKRVLVPVVALAGASVLSLALSLVALHRTRRRR